MQNRQASANAECTAKPPKVVPIAEETSKLIAQDEKTQRIILGSAQR
jgi:hypothetical protein